MNRGFTLLEVLLASLILAILGTLAWGALSTTFLTQKTVEDRTELQEIGTAALMKIREDLTQTFQVEAYHPVTFFKGDDNFDRDRLTFTSLSHVRSGPDRKESDQAEISYETDADPAQQGLYRLRRRESRTIDDRPEEGGDFETLATRVMMFDVEYGDGESYRPTWNVRSPDQINKLPKIVHVTFRLKDKREREETFETFVELPMTESLGVTQPIQRTGGPAPSPVPTP